MKTITMKVKNSVYEQILQKDYSEHHRLQYKHKNWLKIRQKRKKVTWQSGKWKLSSFIWGYTLKTTLSLSPISLI